MSPESIPEFDHLLHNFRVSGSLPGMVRLTSLLTGWYKRTGPAVLHVGLAMAFGLLGWFVYSGRVHALWLVVPPVLALAALFYTKRFTAVLMDDVQDAGNALLVRNRGRGWRIPLTMITSITYSCLAEPPRVTVVYHDAVGATSRLEFVPRIAPRMFFFRPPPVVDDLRQRVVAAGGSLAA